jgi:hypothetical protein
VLLQQAPGCILHRFVDIKGKLPISKCSNRQTARGRSVHMRDIAVPTIRESKVSQRYRPQQQQVSLLGTDRTLSGPAAELADAILASGIRM